MGRLHFAIVLQGSVVDSLFLQLPRLFLRVPCLFVGVSFPSLEPLVEGRQLSLEHFVTLPLGNLPDFGFHEFSEWKDRVREI